jgi:hypothetical protein
MAEPNWSALLEKLDRFEKEVSDALAAGPPYPDIYKPIELSGLSRAFLERRIREGAREALPY